MLNAQSGNRTALQVTLPARGCEVVLDQATAVLASSWSELRDIVFESGTNGEPLTVKLDPSAVYAADSTIKLHDGISILGGACSGDGASVAASTASRTIITCTSAAEPAFNITSRWASSIGAGHGAALWIVY